MRPAHPKQREALEEDIPPLLDRAQLVEEGELAERVEGAEALAELDERRMAAAELLVLVAHHGGVERLLAACPQDGVWAPQRVRRRAACMGCCDEAGGMVRAVHAVRTRL